MIKVSSNQYKKCQSYLKGETIQADMHVLFQTYIQEYINNFGYSSWQHDPIDTLLQNFCREAA